MWFTIVLRSGKEINVPRTEYDRFMQRWGAGSIDFDWTDLNHTTGRVLLGDAVAVLHVQPA